MKNSHGILTALLVALALWGGRVEAQPAAGAATDAEPAPAAETDVPAATTDAAERAPAGAQPAGPLRQQCEVALNQDAGWRAQLKADLLASLTTADILGDARRRAELTKELRPVIHEEDANLMIRNKKHVVYAYAVLWVALAGFLGFLFWHNSRLKSEISRLEHEVARLAKE